MIKHEVIELFIVLSSIIIFQTIDFVDYFFIIVNGFVNIANLGKNVSEGWLDWLFISSLKVIDLSI